MKKMLIVFVVFLCTTGLTHANDLPFVITLPKIAIKLDPQSVSTSTEALLSSALYEGLVSYNPQTLQVVPAAASSWTVSADRLVYTFELRPHLRFSDGHELNAYSFYRAFLRLIDPSMNRDYAYLLDCIKNVAPYRKGHMRIDQLGLKVLDDNHLQITLERPVPYFLSLLAHGSLSPISAYQLPLMWSYYDRVAYSGPYQVIGMDDDLISLEKNPLYWDAEHVKQNRIDIQLRDDIDQITEDFNSYKIDWIAGGNFNPNLVAISGSIHISPGFSSSYYYFAGQQDVWHNADVRNALLLLVNWDALRKTQWIPAAGLVPPIPKEYGYNNFAGFQTNKDKALKLLEQAGYPMGRGLPDISIAINVSDDPTAGVLKESWSILETDVTIDVVDDDYMTYVQQNHPTLAMNGWMADYMDPIAFLQLFMRDNMMNLSVFQDETYDKLVQATDLYEGIERYKSLSDAEQMLLSMGVIIPLGHTPHIHVVDLSSVKGWYENPLDVHLFKFLNIDIAADIPGFSTTVSAINHE